MRKRNTVCIDATYIFMHTSSFPFLRLWGSCFVNPFRRNRGLVGGHQGCGKEAGISKSREERSRSDWWKEILGEEHRVQVALKGRLQTCFICYVLDLGLYEYQSIVWLAMPMIMVFGALFFKECLGASRAELAVFNHNDHLSSFAAP